MPLPLVSPLESLRFVPASTLCGTAFDLKLGRLFSRRWSTPYYLSAMAATASVQLNGADTGVKRTRASVSCRADLTIHRSVLTGQRKHAMDVIAADVA